MSEMEDALRNCAGLMELSARTAPKSAGQDYVVLKVLDSAGTMEVGERMKEIGEKAERPMFVRDGKSVSAAGAMLLVGLKDAKSVGLDCSACGYSSCAALEEARSGAKQAKGGCTSTMGPGDPLPCFTGPICAFRLLDMGIALGSAVKTAGMLNADNRIMYRAGVVARDMGLIDADYIMAIPLAGTGKSVFFDR